MQRRIILLLVLLFALPLFAQTKRLVSRIDVRGNVPADIVTSQSALAEGRSYSDKDLDLAVARLRRLPFVFDASWSVEGDTLVIDVNPMSRFSGDLTGTAAGREGDRSTSVALGGGARLFVGRGGVAQAHVTQALTEGHGETFAGADYSHYGIAGTRLWARGAVGYSLRGNEGADSDPTWSVDVGYPLTIRQSLVASHTDSGFSIARTLPDSPAFNASNDFSTTRLLWTWETSEDPFFARTGEIISAGPSRSEQSARSGGYLFLDPAGNVVFFDSFSESKTTSFSVDAKKYFATGTRGALFAGLGASAFRTESQFRALPDVSFPDTPGGPDFTVGRTKRDGRTAVLSAGYAHNLFDWPSRPGTRQRIEAGASYRRNSFERAFAGGDASVDSYTLDAAYVLRHQYATVRLGLSYLID